MPSLWHYRQARRWINSGEVLAYPTEAVFGLGCDPWNASAVGRILALKQRSWAKGLIVIAADLEQARDLLSTLSPELEQRIQATWPGPVTWLLPASPHTPAWLTGDHSQIALRIPAHPQARALCQWCGPLVSTSANPEGRLPARTAGQVRRYFSPNLPIFPGQVGPWRNPSQIIDSASERCIRA